MRSKTPSEPAETSSHVVQIEGMVIAGHGVASGRSVGSAANPYPAGSIAMQARHFEHRGLDLSDCYLGTINLNIAPHTWRIVHPTHRFEQVQWTHLHPPETFSFLRVHTHWQGQELAGWIYHPHPETKAAHHQGGTTMELLFPLLAGLQVGETLPIRFDAQTLALQATSLRASESLLQPLLHTALR